MKCWPSERAEVPRCQHHSCHRAGTRSLTLARTARTNTIRWWLAKSRVNCLHTLLPTLQLCLPCRPSRRDLTTERWPMCVVDGWLVGLLL